MDVRLVGPSVWTFLHALPWCIEPSQAEPLMLALTNVLPCRYCRESLAYSLQQRPVRAERPIQFAVWLWQLHNAVNQKLGKPLVNVTSALRRRISHAEMTIALTDFLQAVALNYPERPEEGDKIKHGNFFQVLARIIELRLDNLGTALESRDQMYAWVLSEFGLGDDRSVLEQLRV